MRQMVTHIKYHVMAVVSDSFINHIDRIKMLNDVVKWEIECLKCFNHAL